MDDLVAVQVIDSCEDLLDRLGRVLFCEFALVADAVKQLAASGKLGDNVELILRRGQLCRPACEVRGMRTFDSNQSTNLTMCGCLSR